MGGNNVTPTHTLSGSSGRVVASHAKIPGSSPGLTEAIYMHCALVALRGYCPVKGGGYGQSIGSTVSDAIVRAVCGRLQLDAAHWATWVTLL